MVKVCLDADALGQYVGARQRPPHEMNHFTVAYKMKVIRAQFLDIDRAGQALGDSTAKADPGIRRAAQCELPREVRMTPRQDF
jgi:hypothetical protein